MHVKAVLMLKQGLVLVSGLHFEDGSYAMLSPFASTISCFVQPELCNTGLTLAVWVNIGEMVNDDVRKTIFSSGGHVSSSRGISMNLQQQHTRNLKITARIIDKRLVMELDCFIARGPSIHLGCGTFNDAVLLVVVMVHRC